jgi:hypothetical protein
MFCVVVNDVVIKHVNSRVGVVIVSIKNSVLHAIKENLIPGLVLQFFALALVLIYFFVPWTQPAYGWFAALKHDYGSYYAFFATALFGGFIPFMYLLLSHRFEKTAPLFRLFIFYLLFWGLKGVEVDYFYSLQGLWFGYESSVQTIATKVAVDQFIYSTFWAAPTITIAYLWVEHNFSVSASLDAMNKQFFLEKIPTVIFSNWLVWIPAVSIVYSMPQDLQIPLFNLVLCFWVLMLAVLNKK